MIYVQRIYDSSLDAFVYYSLGEVTTEPDSVDTSPNHGGVQYLVADTHVILQKISEGELTIENNGTTIATAVNNINFTGDVAVVDEGGSVTVDIVGGSSATAFAIASFVKDEPNSSLTVRRGDQITGVEAAVTYTSGPPTTASIANTYGGSTDVADEDPGAWTITSPFSRGILAGSIARYGSDLGADPTMTATITAIKGASTKTASFTMTWTRDVYYGVGPAGLSTENQIEGLAVEVLSGTRVRTITVSPNDQKVYYAYPKAYGTATFTLGSFPFDMADPFELQLTRNGVTSTYYVYESTNLLTGSNLSIVIT